MQKEGQGRMSLAFLRFWWRRRARAEPAIDRAYPAWLRAHRPNAAAWRARIAAIPRPPLLSVVMPVHNPNPAWLTEAIGSVHAQFYQNWELLIADDASSSPSVAAVLAKAEGDQRIDVQRLAVRTGISAATNAALARATGAYVLFLDHDDVLAPHALAAVAEAVSAAPALDLVFSDEDQIRDGRRASPYFKPGWNPDLLLGQNCVNHLAAYRRALVAQLGGLRPAYDGSQDLDLALRAAGDAAPGRVRHLPDVLYSWRQSAQAASSASAAACAEAARRALADHLRGRAIVRPHPTLPHWPLVTFELPYPAPTVSIITGGPFELADTAYDPALVECVADPAVATGAVLVFLDARLRPLGPHWLRDLAAQALRPEIGAAGARLEAAGRALLHGGDRLHPELVAVPMTGAADDPGYRGQFWLARSVAAVSGHCLAVRREVFAAAAGFRAEAGDFADVDFCIRLAARGLRTVWEPQVRLAYTAAPAPRCAGRDWMRAVWAETLAADPYGNPNLAAGG